VRFESIRERLRQLTDSKEVAQFLQENLALFNGKSHEPSSFSNLQRLLAEQYYVLAYWQNINETINYRRFFTISDPRRNGASKIPWCLMRFTQLVLRLISRGAVVGLRIDHIDGLRDSEGYLKRLQDRLRPKTARAVARKPICSWKKILERNEELPFDWPGGRHHGIRLIQFLHRILVHPPAPKRSNGSTRTLSAGH